MPTALNCVDIEKALCLGSQQRCGSLKWLDDSYRHPEDFWRALKRSTDERFSVRSASSLFNTYNFYHDIIMRNRNNPAPAIRWYETTDGEREMSYNELAGAATTTADIWGKTGVNPGCTLCMIGTMGVKLMVDLMAALKTGCRISFLFPHGKRFVQNRLEALQPDYIVTDDKYASLMPAWQERMLSTDPPVETDTPQARHVYAYASGQSVFACFDPTGSAFRVPTDITCDAAYLSALRDGTITLGLRPGQAYAAPGFDPQVTLPGLMLAGLLCGATYLHLRPEDIAADPQIVSRTPVQAFGVSKQVRDVLLAHPTPVGDIWQSWFRNPDEAQDMDQWHYFIRHLALTDTPAFNTKWCAPLGGCAFFSIRRKGMAHVNVLPSPGCVWELGDVTGGAFKAPGDSGVCRISPPPALDTGNSIDAGIIIKTGPEWIYAGAGTGRRQGKIFPTDEVLETLATVSKRRLVFCSLVMVPLNDTGLGSRIVLLVFTGPQPLSDESDVEADIRTTIAHEMGGEFQPDSLAFFPLYPRFLSATIPDHDWCRAQYLSGGLFRKSREKIFRKLTHLRHRLIRK